jgi:DNA gyrase/topoisomerase IV subunit B
VKFRQERTTLKNAVPDELRGYILDVKLRHPEFDGQFFEKLRRCQTKGEAKKMVRDHLQELATWKEA